MEDHVQTFCTAVSALNATAINLTSSEQIRNKYMAFGWLLVKRLNRTTTLTLEVQDSATRLLLTADIMLKTKFHFSCMSLSQSRKTKRHVSGKWVRDKLSKELNAALSGKYP